MNSKKYSRKWKSHASKKLETSAHQFQLSRTAVASFSHICQHSLICKVLVEFVPYFNAIVYLANGDEIGKVDEIFGALSDYYISVNLKEPLKIKQFASETQFFVSNQKLLPLERFIHPQIKRCNLLLDKAREGQWHSSPSKFGRKQKMDARNQKKCMKYSRYEGKRRN